MIESLGFYCANRIFYGMDDDTKERIIDDVYYCTIPHEKYSEDKFFYFFHCCLKRCISFRNIFFYRFNSNMNKKMLKYFWICKKIFPDLKTIENNCKNIDGGLRILHNYCGISCEKIGMFCSIGPGVIIGGKNEGKPTIGDYVTNCANSTVIGNNSLIGAGSLVTKDVTENVIVVGCPAKILKKRN